MKDKNVKNYNRGKKQLFTVSLIICLASILAIVGAVVLIVRGVQVNGIGSRVWRFVLAILLLIFGLIFGYAGFAAFFTSFGMMKQDSGNIKETNRAIGTTNINKCDKCGHENEQGAQFCKNCGESMKDYLECECGTRSPKDSEFCSNCGKKFK